MEMNAQLKFFGNGLTQSEAGKPRTKIPRKEIREKPRAKKEEKVRTKK